MRFILLASLFLLVPTAIGAQVHVPAHAALATSSQAVTARLGISAGEALDQIPLGAAGEVLRMTLPLLWTTAEQLEVSVMSASVGQGFWSEDGELDAEKDLDLTVTGRPESIETFAAILGKAWEQSTVYVWYPEPNLGQQATATIPLPAGAFQLSDAIYAAMAAELTGGAHVKYAADESLIFVAKTDEAESDEAFYTRMARLVGILNAVGVQTGPIEPGRAHVTVVRSDEYDQYLTPGVAGRAA